MANYTDPIGAVLMFGDDLIDKLNKIDKQFAQIEKRSADMTKTITQAFNSTGGMTSFSAEVDKLKDKISSLGDQTRLGKFNSLGKAIGQVTSSTADTVKQLERVKRITDSNAESMAKAAAAGKKFGSAIFDENSIAMMEKRVERLQKAINTGKVLNDKGTLQGAKAGSLTAAMQQQYQNEIDYWRTRIQEASKSEQTLTDIALQSARKKLEIETQYAEKVYQTDVNLFQRRQQLQYKVDSLTLKKSDGGGLTNEEKSLLKAYAAELDTTKQKLEALKREYPQLAREAKKAFRTQELETAVQNARRLREEQERYARESADVSRRTPQNALAYSKNATSIQEMRRSLDYLRDAQARCNVKTREGRKDHAELTREIKRQEAEIDRLTGKTRGLQSAHRGLLDVGGQLRGMFMSVFSLYQVTGFIKKMVEVRGEFELQHKALGAIIQDLDKADKLWSQITELAVKSPFRVKELVTYTKQLAAYRIETDKIFDVTKRLADVSAGLGVDMNRLILAYGQVKAANYLRGQELRQFSEAGINILGELAAQFSEVEGVAVSTGEVFERVSKRMVKFEDVAKVFERLTDEGGIFYQMQEKQAETLQGRISNLKDSIDLMFDSIGQSNQGILNKSVELAKKLIENWQKAKIVIVPLVNYLVGRALWAGGVKMVALYISRIKDLVAALKNLRKAQLLTQAGVTGLGGAIVLLASIIMSVVMAAREAGRFMRELNAIVLKEAESFDTAAKNYDKLKTRLEESNEGSEERKKIISQINREYGEYLPNMLNEINALETLSNSYEDVIKKMKEAAAAKAFEKGMERIESEYQEQLTKSVDGLRKALMRITLTKSATGKVLTPNEEDINNLSNIIVKGFEKAEDKSYSGFIKFVNETVREYFGRTDLLVSDLYSDLSKIADTLVKRYEREAELQGMIDMQFKETMKSQKAYQAMKELELKTREKIADIDRGLDIYKNVLPDGSRNDWEKKVQKMRIQLESALEGIEIKLKFGQISEDEAKRQKEKLTTLADDWAKVINERIIGEFGGMKDDVLGFVAYDEFINGFLITNTKAAEGISANIKALKEMEAGTVEFLQKEAQLIDAGVQKNKNLYNTEKRRLEVVRKILGFYKEQVDETYKMSKAMIDSINNDERLAEDYKLGITEQFKSLSQVQSDVKKKLDESTKALDFLISKQRQGIVVNDAEIAQLKEKVKQYGILNELLDINGQNEKDVVGNQEYFREMFKSDVEKFGLKEWIGISETEDRAAIKAHLDKRIKYFTEIQEELLGKDKSSKNALKEGQFGELTNGEVVKQIDVLIPKLTELYELYFGKYKDNGDRVKKSDFAKMYRIIVEMNHEYDKLRKNFSSKESREKVFSGFRDAFNEIFEGKMDINSVDFTSKEGTAAALKRLEPIARTIDEINKNKDSIVALLKAIGEVEVQIHVDKRQEARDKFKREFEDLFDGYQFQKEMEGLNVPPILLKKLFGVTPTSINDMRGVLQTMFRAGTLDEDLYKDLREKVNDLEKKEQLAQLKEYVKYLRNAMNERVKIEYEALRKIDNIRKMSNVDDETKGLMIAGVSRDMEQAMQKQLWEEFKGEDGYISLFQDLDRQSTTALMRMKAKLDELRGSLTSLDPSQLKEITEQMEKLDDTLAKRNPLGGLFDALKGTEGKRTRHEAETDYANGLEELNKLQQQYNTQQLEYQRNMDAGNEGEAEANRLAMETLDQRMKAQKAANDAAYQEIKAWDTLIARWEVARQYISELSSEVYDLVEAFGGVKGESAKAFIELGGAVLDSVTAITSMVNTYNALTTAEEAAAAAGVAANTAAGWIGLVATAISLLITLATKFAKFHDAKYADQITKLKKSVDGLQHSYEKMQKMFERSYALDELNTSSQAMLSNINAQIAAYERMRSAELAKKKSDEDAVRDYNRSIEELTEKADEVADNLRTSLGGIGVSEYASLAEAFADAWLSAFNETGDGMDALSEKWDDVVNNMVKRQLVTRGLSKYMEGTLNYLNTALDDSIMSESEYDALLTMVKTASEGMNEYMKGLAASIGFLGTGETKLSGLQEGIQGMTEQTAEVLAAYANSLRLIESQQLSVLQDLAARVLSSDGAANPVLAELRRQTAYLDNIHSLLNSIIERGSAGGRALRIVS